MELPEFDLTIVGGGLVGLSLAPALRGSGLRLALVERSDLSAETETEPDDRALIALLEKLLADKPAS